MLEALLVEESIIQGFGVRELMFLRWILKILHDPKYLKPWELCYDSIVRGHAGFLVSKVVPAIP